MIIIEDTRNKPTKHKLKHAHFERVGVEIVRSKIIVGDYMLPKGSASIDSKQNIMEIANNLRQGHARFRREAELAQKLGIQLYILVENSDGVDSLNDLANWRECDKSFFMRKRRNNRAVRISGKQLARAASTMSERDSLFWGFCKPEDAGKRIIEILQAHEAQEG